MSRASVTQLGDVTTKVGSGATPRGGEAAYKPAGIPLIRSMNVHFDGFRRDGLAFLDEEQARALKNVEVCAGDVLLNITGASIGRVAVAPAAMDGARVNQHVCIIRPDHRLDSSYLRWYLASPFQQRLINGIESGATRQALTKEKILRFEVPLLPLAHQREIVAEIEEQFSRLDQAVANLKRVKANLKRYKAGVLNAAVEGRLVPSDAEIARERQQALPSGAGLLADILKQRREQWAGRGTYREPALVSESVEDAVPEGWTAATLNQLALQIADVDHKMPRAVDHGIPYVSTRDFIDEDTIDFDGAKRISLEDFEALSRKVKPARGDLLLSRYGTVGEVRAVETDAAFQASYSVAIIKPVRGFDLADYLNIALRSDAVRAQIKRDVRATAQPDLGLAHIREFVVPFPPASEQRRIVAEVDRRLSIVREVEAEVDANLKRAQALRQAVLARAFAAPGESGQ